MPSAAYDAENRLTQVNGGNQNGAISTRNQIAASGYTYDSAGNLIAAPPTGTTYTYDAENHLISTGGVTYTYDGDGKRVTKSSGTIYSYLPSGEVLMESSLTSGYEQFLYFYFNGQRVANTNNLNALGEFAWYFTDHLGSTRFYWQWDGDGGSNRSDFYPFGGERVLQSDEPSHFRFTGKERDSESGNDNFGARFYSSSLGRFMSPDWSAKPAAVPYASLGNPQTLNLYAYVSNNPVNRTDPTGHKCVTDANGKEHGCFWQKLGNYVEYGVYVTNQNIEKALGARPELVEHMREYIHSQTGMSYATLDKLANKRVMDIANEVRLEEAEGVYGSGSALGAVAFPMANLQHEFSHAPDFGVKGSWNKEAAAQFQNALEEVVNGPNTKEYSIEFRGQSGFRAFVDQPSGKAVIFDQTGNLRAAWSLSADQVQGVVVNGKLW